METKDAEVYIDILLVFLRLTPQSLGAKRRTIFLRSGFSHGHLSYLRLESMMFSLNGLLLICSITFFALDLVQLVENR